MSKKKTLSWSRLDNAAKIFPPTAHGSETGVFRLHCELTEPVNPALLQQALDQTLAHFPHLCMVMRRGFFWYYLEQATQHPRIQPEHAPPCAPLYENSASPLFEVSFWRHKINLDVFHVLADGSGAITFFTALIDGYLRLTHPGLCTDVPPYIPTSNREADSFQKYYTPRQKRRSTSLGRAFHLRGIRREDHQLRILEGVANVQQLLDAAHRHHTTLTVYLTALLMQAIHEEMFVRDCKRPVVITVPVDLRAYFPSESARNFFGTIRVGYRFSPENNSFDELVEAVSNGFRENLAPEQLSARLSSLAALEHNPVIRPIPLPLKNAVLRFSGFLSRKGETAALSNIGRLKLPAPLDGLVSGFGVFMSTASLQLCTCTYGDRLHFGFTSVYLSTAVQRNFFRALTVQGIDVEIRSNEFFEREDASCSNVPTVM